MALPSSAHGLSESHDPWTSSLTPCYKMYKQTWLCMQGLCVCRLQGHQVDWTDVPGGPDFQTERMFMVVWETSENCSPPEIHQSGCDVFLRPSHSHSATSTTSGQRIYLISFSVHFWKFGQCANYRTCESKSLMHHVFPLPFQSSSPCQHNWLQAVLSFPSWIGDPVGWYFWSLACEDAPNALPFTFQSTIKSSFKIWPIKHVSLPAMCEQVAHLLPFWWQRSNYGTSAFGCPVFCQICWIYFLLYLYGVLQKKKCSFVWISIFHFTLSRFFPFYSTLDTFFQSKDTERNICLSLLFYTKDSYKTRSLYIYQ